MPLRGYLMDLTTCFLIVVICAIYAIPKNPGCHAATTTMKTATEVEKEVIRNTAR